MKNFTKETGVGLFVLICLLAVGYLTVKMGKLEIFGGHYTTYLAKFTTVTGLRPGSFVEMAGVEIGTVENITLDQDNYLVVVKLKVQDNIVIHDDAIAAIKTSGLIGDKYVSIIPGGAGDPLGPGGTIIETQAPLDVEELISKYAFGSVEE